MDETATAPARMDYAIMRAQTFDELEARVRLALERGWHPQGGPFVFGKWCAQAMVRMSRGHDDGAPVGTLTRWMKGQL
jgi:Domain of unknown function (DUF1737)